MDDLWYKNDVIYSLDLETFMDGNADGVGDFEGLISRLDYLDSLGIDAIWLAPFQPSPNRDNGYDIKDYFGVDPRHGSSGEFVEFMHHAKKRGMRVIIDLVVNHTSDQHPWFKAARRDKSSPFRDWYLWSKQRPAGWNEGMVFPGVQKAVWTRDPVAGEYYYHRFYEFQPDLNVANPAVRNEIARIMGYWLQLGVDGFRVDAVPFIIERPPLSRRGPKLRFAHLTDMRKYVQWRSCDAVLLGEANVMPAQNREYFGDEGDGIHMMFNFWVNQRLFYALASGDTRPLQTALVETKDIPSASQWANFLRNHDELDIDRLKPQQREAVFARFGPRKDMQLYGRGIRRRLASMLGDRRHVELANSVMFSLPGAPVIRYGDEIGMGENLELKERDAVRTPMQWSNQRNAGFSTARRLVHPVIRDGAFGYSKVNVEDQRRDQGSLLNWMTRLIRARKECREIGWGDWDLVKTGSAQVLGICYAWRERRVLVLHNFSPRQIEVRFKLAGADAHLLSDVLGTNDSKAQTDGKHRVLLPEYGYRWYRVGGLNYALPGGR